MDAILRRTGSTSRFVRFCAGASGGPAFGVVTFLFTDIEGSTRRWKTTRLRCGRR